MTTRETYIAKMKTQLDELNEKMNKLDLAAKDAKQEARAKYVAEMHKIREQSELARTKLNELMTAGETTWENMVADMEKFRDAFVHSFNYFKSQVKTEESEKSS